ncbi:hypothetical protein QMO17_31580, partial [Klebsiella pneumoniae]|nr:hypothetical protein [Klebsiella pneumoniae]
RNTDRTPRHEWKMPTGARELSPELAIPTLEDGDSVDIGDKETRGAPVTGNSRKRGSAQVYRPHGACFGKRADSLAG